ncbi:MAG: regulatory protein RecX [Bacteroidota bacterium]
MNNKSNKITTPKKALSKAREYCAYSERCQQEMRNKLYEWGLIPDVVESIIAELIIENFINEERYAKMFAGGKFRIKKWGRIKIRQKLQAKNISEYCIRKGFDEIDEADYMKTLKEISEKKARLVNETDEYIKRDKIAKYIINKGFEPEIVWKVLIGD